MNGIFKSLLLAQVLVIALSACGSRKKMVYFQTPENQLRIESEIKNYTPVIKVDDYLSILVTAEDPETAIPFNLPTTGIQQSVNAGYTQGTPTRVGYLVDPAGFVNLPIIGKMQLAGLTRTEATEQIEQKLTDYLKSPLVNIQIENFKVTVLGDVTRPGTFRIPNERITLLEAIGLAGDLNMSGKRHNVLVIRDNNGIKTEHRIDLTSKELFTSEVYYLEQNDVVYVEPNAAARSNGTIWRTSGTIFISLTSLVVTSIALISK